MNKLCISSLVVQANPADLERVQKEIESLPGSEVMGQNEQGKLVVVLDLPSNRLAPIFPIRIVPGDSSLP